MPKEVIYDNAEMYDVVVAWASDPGLMDLRIGIQAHDGTPIVGHLIVDGVTSVSANAATAELAHFRSLWGSLDRSGANRLIRALRRARDQAFGRDE